MESNTVHNYSFYILSLTWTYTGHCWTSGSCYVPLKSSTPLQDKIYDQAWRLLDGRWFWQAGNTPSEIMTDYSDETDSLFARISALQTCHKMVSGS